MNQATGQNFPQVLDLVTERDGICYLYLVQENELDGDELLALQERLNSYLGFIVDGQLQRNYPALANHQKVVRINLQHTPAEFAGEFFERVKSAFAAHGVTLEVAVET
jgi:hypothetical protein